MAAGAAIGFTVTVRNDGAGIARSVTVSDTLPTDAGLAWVLDDDAGGACHLAGGIVTCAPADLAPGRLIRLPRHEPDDVRHRRYEPGH